MYGLPDVSFAVNQYKLQITLQKVNASDTVTQTVETLAVVQPWKPKSYDLHKTIEHPLGYIQVHINLSDPLLENADYIIYNGIKHRIMNSNSYNEAGYMEYLATSDFT